MSPNSASGRSSNSMRRRARSQGLKATTRFCSGARLVNWTVSTRCKWPILSIRNGSLSMISYLVDAILLAALAFTSMRVAKMHRELARLRAYQGEFSTVVNETTGAFDTVVSAAHDFAGNLGRLANSLNGRIEQ